MERVLLALGLEMLSSETVHYCCSCAYMAFSPGGLGTAHVLSLHKEPGYLEPQMGYTSGLAQ